MKKDKIIEQLLLIIFLSIIILFPLFELINFYGAYFGSQILYFLNSAYILWLSLPILIIIYVYNIITKRYKITYFDIILYVLIFFGLLSTRFSINMRVSVFGCINRYEGLLSLLTYYFLFLNAGFFRNTKKIYLILNTLIITGLVQALYAFIQLFIRQPFIISFEAKYMAMGLSENPNFYGSYMVLLCLITTCLWLLSNKNKTFYLITSLIFYINIVLAESTGPFIGFMSAIIFLIIFLLLKKRMEFKKAIVLFLVQIFLLFIVTITTIFLFQRVYKDVIAENYIILADFEVVRKSILENNIVNTGSSRLEIWENAINIYKRYPLLGSGLDTFGIVYNRETGMVIYDKAHNVYLQILVTNGIFALISYLTLLFLIFIRGIKNNSIFVWILLISFIGYSLQAFLNINIIAITPIFYIISGFIVGLTSKNDV